MELETIKKSLECRSSSQSSTYDSLPRFLGCVFLHFEHHILWEVRLYFQVVIDWRWALGDLPLGRVVPVPLPGCVNKGWMEGVVAGVVKFLRWALLSFGTFALAAERSSLSTCLATAASEVSKPRPWPTDPERKSEVRGEGKDPFGGT